MVVMVKAHWIVQCLSRALIECHRGGFRACAKLNFVVASLLFIPTTFVITCERCNIQISNRTLASFTLKLAYLAQLSRPIYLGVRMEFDPRLKARVVGKDVLVYVCYGNVAQMI